MHLMISASQKNKNSNSKYFLKYLSQYLTNYEIIDLKNTNYKEILKLMKKSSSIIIAMPLYVDSPSSITLELFDYIYDHKINLNNKPIYVIINCGFREGIHNQVALNIIKNWCLKVGAEYAGCVMIGAGEIVGKRKYRLISHRAFKCLNKFGLNIKQLNKVNDVITTMDILNNKTFCTIANIEWMKKALINGLSKREIKRQ